MCANECLERTPQCSFFVVRKIPAFLQMQKICIHACPPSRLPTIFPHFFDPMLACWLLIDSCWRPSPMKAMSPSFLPTCLSSALFSAPPSQNTRPTCRPAPQVALLNVAVLRAVPHPTVLCSRATNLLLSSLPMNWKHRRQRLPGWTAAVQVLLNSATRPSIIWTPKSVLMSLLLVNFFLVFMSPV